VHQEDGLQNNDLMMTSIAGPVTNQTRDHLCDSLDGLILDPDLRAMVGAFRKRDAQTIDATELADLLERVIKFSCEQHAKLEREKEQLLSQLGAGLDEIAAFLMGERAEHSATVADSDTLSTTCCVELEQLRASFAGQPKSDEVLGQVDRRLAMIGTHLRRFRERQETRTKAFEERAQRLGTRVLELEQQTRQLRQDLTVKRRLAIVDTLTGIPNRAAYDERIEAEFRYWMLSGNPTSILIWDIDRFKLINDQYGHKAGDRVLRALAQRLAKRIRDCDFIARYGGEEIVMLLSGVSGAEAHETADQIRAEIAQLRFVFREQRIYVTASCGAATFQAGDTPDKLFERADRALYAAKKMGRNRCVLAPPDPAIQQEISIK
jgi:diguanylate cyclase